MVLQIGGIILENSDKQVSEARLCGKICEITVKDKSAGGDKQDHHHLLAPLYPQDSNNTYKDTGIGLAICRRIVESHQGKISVERDPEKGMNFIIKLPVIQPKPGNKAG